LACRRRSLSGDWRGVRVDRVKRGERTGGPPDGGAMASTTDGAFDVFYDEINLPGDHRTVANLLREWVLRPWSHRPR